MCLCIEVKCIKNKKDKKLARDKHMKMNLDKQKIKIILSLAGAYAGAAVFFLYFDISSTRENFLIYGVLMAGIYFALQQLTAFLFRRTKQEGAEESDGSKYKVLKDSADTARKIVMLAAAAVMAFISCKYVSLKIDGNAVVPIAFLTYCFYILLRRINLKNRGKEAAVSLIFSLLWSTAAVVGRKINMVNKVFVSEFELFDIVRIAAFSLITFAAVFNCLDMLLRSEVKNKAAVSFSKKRWGVAALLMILCWSPYFLTYFPGNLSVDSYSSIAQAVGEELLNNHHPVMFTAIVTACLKAGGLFGGLEAGIAIFSILQMTVLALTLSRCLEWMREKQIRFIVRVGAFLFFAFSPLIAMYSITMWKDILFSCWVLLLAMLLFEVISDETRTRIREGKVLFKLILLCLLTAFGRNNGIYIVAAVLLILLIYYREMWKKLGPLFVALTAAIVLIQGPGYDALHIEKGHFAESVGIPLQQIGYTVKYEEEGITEEQKEFISKIMPLDEMKEAYDPAVSNGIKFHKDFNNEFLEANKGEFVKVWAEMLLKHPSAYIKAYCMQTVGYWQVDTIGYTYAFGADDYSIDVNETNVIDKTFGIDLAYMIENRLPALYSVVPFVNLFFSPAVPVWLMLGCVMVLIVKKRKRLIIPLLPLIALWGTIMIATPAFGEFRYVFCLNLAIPFVVTVILCNKQKKKADTDGKE